MTAIILAGGKSSRMKGLDKAFLKLGQQTLIKRQINLLKKIFKKIIIVTTAIEKYKNIKGVRVISDIIPQRGPLGGIYSGLVASKTFYNFVVACDMPFINVPLIKYMLAKKNNYDMMISLVNGRYHPLFGVYSKNCIRVIAENLRQNILNVTGILPKVKTRSISQEEIEKFDPEMLSLVNINTQEDLEKIRGKKEK